MSTTGIFSNNRSVPNILLLEDRYSILQKCEIVDCTRKIHKSAETLSNSKMLLKCSEDTIKALLTEGSKTGAVDLSDLGLNKVPAEIFILEMDEKQKQKFNENAAIKSQWLIETEKKVNNLIYQTLLDDNGKASFLMKELKKTLIFQKKQQINKYTVKKLDAIEEIDESKEYILQEKNAFFPLSILNFGLEEPVIVKQKEKKQSSVPKPRKITKIILSNNCLKDIPYQVKYLKNLKDLDIGKNKLYTIPNDLNKTALEFLWVNDNALQFIPHNLYTVSTLKVLVLSNNQLIHLPSFIGFLYELQTLDVSSNYLTELPFDLPALTKLEYLNVSENMLKKLPDEFGLLENLIEINFSDNNLNELPDLQGLRNLRTIEIGRNRITNLPMFPVSIISIFAEYNLISELSQLQMTQLFNLKTLNLNGNRLKILPNNISCLNSLRCLQIAENNLHTLPVRLGHMLHLKYLNVQFNPIVDIPEYLLSGKDLGKLLKFVRESDHKCITCEGKP